MTNANLFANQNLLSGKNMPVRLFTDVHIPKQIIHIGVDDETGDPLLSLTLTVDEAQIFLSELQNACDVVSGDDGSEE